jgi:hypothetical protein
MKPVAAAVFFALIASPAPAFATGAIECSGDRVSVDLVIGRLEVLSVVRAVVAIGDKNWSTQPDVVAGEPIATGQAFQDERQLLVDFTDHNVEEIVGRLRVYSLSEGEAFASGGVMSFKDEGAFVVDCSERG